MDSSTLYDVIIVGGGIMGSTTAYYLTKKDPELKVAVIERDLAYTRASTTLSMVNARIQFSLKQNVHRLLRGSGIGHRLNEVRLILVL